MKDIRSGSILMTAKAEDGVWPASSVSPSPPILALCVVRASLFDWHSHLGHPSTKILQRLTSSKCISFSSSSLLSCNACLSDKSIKISFSESTLKSNSPLQLIFSDVVCSTSLKG